MLPILNLLNRYLNLSELLTKDFADYTKEYQSNEETKDLKTQELFIHQLKTLTIYDTLSKF